MCYSYMIAHVEAFMRTFDVIIYYCGVAMYIHKCRYILNVTGLEKTGLIYGTVQLQLHTRVICHAWYHALFSVKRKFVTRESKYSHACILPVI